MKSRNASTSTKGVPKVVFQSDIAHEENGGPSPEDIRLRAFELHLEHGGIHGHELDDWLQAERELQEQYRLSEKRAKTN